MTMCKNPNYYTYNRYLTASNYLLSLLRLSVISVRSTRIIASEAYYCGQVWESKRERNAFIERAQVSSLRLSRASCTATLHPAVCDDNSEKRHQATNSIAHCTRTHEPRSPTGPRYCVHTHTHASHAKTYGRSRSCDQMPTIMNSYDTSCSK